MVSLLRLDQGDQDLQRSRQQTCARCCYGYRMGREDLAMTAGHDVSVQRQRLRAALRNERRLAHLSPRRKSPMLWTGHRPRCFELKLVWSAFLRRTFGRCSPIGAGGQNQERLAMNSTHQTATCYSELESEQPWSCTANASLLAGPSAASKKGSTIRETRNE